MERDGALESILWDKRFIAALSLVLKLEISFDADKNNLL